VRGTRGFTALRFVLALGVVLGAGAASAAVPPNAPPIAGSPGAADRALAVRDGCPTFSWSEVEGRREYEIAAYRLGEDGVAGEAPLLRTRIEGAFLSWTPSLEKCLPPGRYAWVVRANAAEGWTEWSEPRLFEVRGVAQGGRRPDEKAAGEREGRAAGRPHSADVGDGAFPAVSLSLDTSLAGGSSKLGALHGDMFSPPACTSMFTDVPPGDSACPWIEQLARDQITVGCGGGNYCPDSPVTHRQVALLLERSMRGTDTFRPGSTTADIPNRPPAAANITPLQTAGDVGKYSSITIGADGLGLISYWNSVGVLEVAHCSNAECTEASVSPVDFAPFFTYYTSIAIGTDGFALISYWDANNGDLKVAHCSNINCSDADVTPLDTEGDQGGYTSIAIGADGLGLISYQDAGARYLKVAHCANVACTSADQITTLDNASAGAWTSIAIGADGLALISYQGTSFPDLKVAHCSDIACTAATNTTLDLATGSLPGTGTSVTIGADGLGLIAYGDDNEPWLKVAHCSNLNCTAATITPFSFDPAGSQYPSITIGADGLGLISSHRFAPGDLTMGHCSNTVCTAATITPVDTAGIVGKYTSITLGADGLGLVSYYDETNGDLKVAHCSNVLCAPYFRRR